MNLFFYLQIFILNYSFIVILSDHIFCICFIKTQPFVKRKPVKTEKNTGTIAFRFRQVLLYMNHPNLLRRAMSFSRKLTVPQRKRNSPLFYRARMSITSTCSCCEPGQSIPRSLILFLISILMLSFQLC